MIYIRWRRGASRRGRVYQTAGTLGFLPCPHCRRRLDAWTDDPAIQLIAVGPDSDAAGAEHAAGHWYAATAVPMHETCALSNTDADLETLINQLVVIHPNEVDLHPDEEDSEQ
jgi:hypothetical protein